MFSSLKEHITVFYKNHKKLSILFSIASIVSVTWFSVEKLTIFDKFFVNFGGTIIYQAPPEQQTEEQPGDNAANKRNTGKAVGESENVPTVKITPPDTASQKNVSRTLELNEEASNTISTRNGKDIYRFHLPAPGRLSLRWQAGERTSSKELYNVSLHHSYIGEPIITYTMTSTTSYITSEPVFVTSGDYSVVVKSKAGIAVPYHMIVQSDPMDSIEIEENNSFSSATPIENNKGYSGSLQGRQDEDYYRFKLSESSAVNVTLGTNGNEADVAAYTVVVYNEDRSILTEAQAKGSASFSETGNLYLRAGAYYASVKKGNTWSGGAYTLTVRTSRKDVTEAESNDTLETANAIPVNKEVLASVGWEGDVDCFLFTLDKKAVVRPYFDFKRLGTDLRIYTLTLGNVNGKEIATFDFRGTGEPSKVIGPIKLEAGTYAMRLTRIKRDEVPSALHEYTLRISAQPTK